MCLVVCRNQSFHMQLCFTCAMLEHLICRRQGRLSAEAAETGSVHSALSKAAGRLCQPQGCGQGRAGSVSIAVLGACSWHWRPGLSRLDLWKSQCWVRCCWHLPAVGEQLLWPAVQILLSCCQSQALCLGLAG